MTSCLNREDAFARDLHLHLIHHRHESPALMRTWLELHESKRRAIQEQKDIEAAKKERMRLAELARQEKYGVNPPVMLSEIWGGIEEISDALCARKAELAFRKAKGRGYSATGALAARQKAYEKERVRCDKVKRAFAAIARIHGVTVNDLIADFGPRNLMPIRYCAWHRAMVRSGYSTSVIGKFANRCRTTIRTGVKTHCEAYGLTYPSVQGKR